MRSEETQKPAGRRRTAVGMARTPRKHEAASWKKDPGGRRQRVLDEATRLFSERGYASVSTGDIARAAGVAEGNIYHYFGSKPELLRAVGERYGAAFAAAMFGGVEPHASVATIRTVVTRAFDFVGASWPGFGVFLLSDGATAASLAQKANRSVVTRAVEAVLNLWTERGVIERIDAPVVSELLFGLMESALRIGFAGQTPIGRQRCIDATVTAISRILAIDDDAASDAGRGRRLEAPRS